MKRRVIAALWHDKKDELPSYSGKAAWTIGAVSKVVLNARRYIPDCEFVLLVDDAWHDAYRSVIPGPAMFDRRPGVPDCILKFSGTDVGGWSKLCEVFRPDLAPALGERDLFIGLDTVFVGDATWLFDWNHSPVGLPLDPYHAPERCDAVVSFDRAGAELVWSAYEASRDADGMRQDHYAGRPSEMALLRRLSKEHDWTALEPGFHKLRSYKVHGNERIDGTSVVYFHGTPILIVELDRDDAMDGHKAGVYCPDEVKLLEGSSE